MQSLINILVFLLSPFFGPYRVVAYKFRTFGNKTTGLLTWLGVAIAYPAYAASNSREFIVSWIALAVWAYVQMFVQWCSSKERRDERVSQCWAGKLEVFLAGAFGLTVATLVDGRAGDFFLIGYACSVAQIWLLRARHRLEIWTPEDTERLLVPLRAAWMWACEVSPVIFVNAARVGRFLIEVGKMTLKGIALLFRRNPQPVAVMPGGHVIYNQPPPTSFMQRVKSHLVAHVIISFISGLIGLNVLVAVFSIVLAVPLWLLGAKVHLPEFVTAPVWGFFERAKDGMEGAKEKAVDRLQEEREEIRQRLREKRAEISERLHQLGKSDRVDEVREEIEDEVGSRARAAVWRSMVH